MCSPVGKSWRVQVQELVLSWLPRPPSESKLWRADRGGEGNVWKGLPCTEGLFLPFDDTSSKLAAWLDSGTIGWLSTFISLTPPVIQGFKFW